MMQDSRLDNEEVNDLLNNGNKHAMLEIESGGGMYGDDRIAKQNRIRWCAILSLLFLGSLGGWHVLREKPPKPTVDKQGIIQFTCTNNLKVAENYDAVSFEKEYGEDTKQIKTNLSAFSISFRNETFDNWGRSYEQVKNGTYHWKSTHYPPNIKSGQSMYESACGVGLNLYMTLEILKEHNIDNIVVYGNEYLAESTERANVVFDKLPPFNARKGKICTGDSTELAFVPSNAFDLVFTGYISPLSDPLHYNKPKLDDNYDIYTKLCDANDENSMKLAALAQEKQEDFYGQWVGEMVRIAKPGKAVIVEEVSHPYCDERWDWGGVAPVWWKGAVIRYGWDVDPTSFKFEKDTIFRNRYHVFMRKNKVKRNKSG